MRIRRKQSSRPWIALTIKSLVLGFAVVVVIIYLVAFATVIGTESQVEIEKEIRESLNTVLKKAHNIRGTGQQALQIPADHGVHDQIAVDRLADGEQQHEIAPKAEVKTDAVKIGFAVTITGCGSDPITEGAAVLKHSIHLASIHGNLGGRYDYVMYAIYHPEAIKCAKTLESLGYTLVERETPVAVKDIKGDFLRSRIEKNGCCGEKELVKLEAYTLTQHPVIVHLDLDTLVLKPLDDLFDWMLAGDQARSFDYSGVTRQWPDKEIPKKVNAFLTRDCTY